MAAGKCKGETGKSGRRGNFCVVYCGKKNDQLRLEEKSMKLLYSLFRQDPDSREGVILTTCGLGAIVNILCSVLKIIIGLAVSSIAVVS